MAEYQIEKGIPIPPEGRSSRKQKGSNVFMRMDIGDSVFVPAAEYFKRGNSLRSYAAYKMSAKFSRRAWCKDGVEGVRVWRIR